MTGRSCGFVMVAGKAMHICAYLCPVSIYGGWSGILGMLVDTIRLCGVSGIATLLCCCSPQLKLREIWLLLTFTCSFSEISARESRWADIEVKVYRIVFLRRFGGDFIGLQGTEYSAAGDTGVLSSSTSPFPSRKAGEVWSR